jgi:exoribonuclease R
MIFGQNSETLKYELNTFVVIIKFSSKYTYKTKKPDTIQKEGISLISQFSNILVNTKKLDCKRDMYAIVEIISHTEDKIICNVLSYLGDVGDKNIEIKLMEYAGICHWSCGQKTIDKFKALIGKDLTPDRLDLTHVDFYSIDPIGCRDIDDALGVEIHDDYYNVYVSIADPSSFIEQDSEIDNILKKRCESVYTPSQVNMIAEELSINHMSLLEGSQKRAFTLILKIDKQYNIISYCFKKTTIQVLKNLSYEEAETMLDNPNIKLLYDCAKHLKSISQSDLAYDTHQMVEVYMIYANKYCAETIVNFDSTNVLLRNHKINNTTSSIDMTNVDKILIQKHNLTQFEQAQYQIGSENSYHMGLQQQYYTHFTSPIRRYADIIVHRQLYNSINSIQLTPISPTTIFLMNFYKKYYKQLARYNNLITLSHNLGTNCITTMAYITYIDIAKESIRIFVPEFNVDYDYNLSNDKIKHILAITGNDIKITIFNKHTHETTEYNLFQSINVKMIVATQNFIRLKFEII